MILMVVIDSRGDGIGGSDYHKSYNCDEEFLLATRLVANSCDLPCRGAFELLFAAAH